MNVWTIVLIASVAVLALKLVGYAVPTSLVEKPGPARISSLLTVALLSALIAVQTFVSSGHTLALDARLPALLVAAGLFALRVPFILVLVAAAATAAVIRMLA